MYYSTVFVDNHQNVVPARRLFCKLTERFDYNKAGSAAMTGIIKFKTPDKKEVAFGKYKTRFAHSEPDEPGEFAWLDKNIIKVDHLYQREEHVQRSRIMAANFSWMSFGALTICLRPIGDYFCPEGQHRLGAAKLIPEIKEVPCMIFRRDSIIDEAKGFYNANVLKVGVSALEKYRALLAAQDVMTIKTSEIINKYNITLSKSARNRLETKSIGMICNLVRRNAEVTDYVMHMCAELSVQSGDYIAEILIDGLFYMITHGLHFNKNRRLRERLLKVGSAELVSRAKAMAAAYTKGGGKQWAIGMEGAINHHLRENNEYKMTAEVSLPS